MENKIVLSSPFHYQIPPFSLFSNPILFTLLLSPPLTYPAPPPPPPPTPLLRFRMVPFLTELRAVMDWVWTDTTLSLSSWICVDDIYANIFILKCWRESEKVSG